MKIIDWRQTHVAADETYHYFNDLPLYPQRFIHVLPYHAPGLAPVRDASGAYHIDTTGQAIYQERYLNTFGYYEHYAAVASSSGCFHLTTTGKPAYTTRYAWCGNFQQGACVVRDNHNHYFHINTQGHRLYPQNYAYVGDFRENYAVVCDENGLHTHIDRMGQLLHGQWFIGLNVFHKGVACARDAAGWFHINKKGEALYSKRYRTLEPFYNHLAYAETQEGKRVLLNLQGDEVITIADKSENSCLHALSADAVGYWKTQTLYAAVKLAILDHLPNTTQHIAAKLKLRVDLCQRLLRGLYEMDIVTQQQTIWSLTERGHLLTPTMTSPMAAAIRVWADDHYRQWLYLTDCLKEVQQIPAYFTHLAQDKMALANYQTALSLYAAEDYQPLFEKAWWQEHTIVLDAGGGTGTLLHQLLNHQSHLQGILLDLPEVINLIQQKHARATYAAVDLFADWGHKADAILFARVLHDWNDGQALTLLKQASLHLQPQGKIYILDMVLPEGTGQGGLLDLNMLVMTGGQERTFPQWNTLIQDAGLRLITNQPCSPILNTLVLKHAA